MDVFPEFKILIPVADAAVVITGCPNLARETEFFLGAKGKAAFDELHTLFQGLGRGEKKMEMIRHEHEFVQFIFSLIAIVKKDIEEETSHSVGLEHRLSLGACGSEKVGIQNRYLGG